jgi:hypothetical protein
MVSEGLKGPESYGGLDFAGHTEAPCGTVATRP